jgi:hypothetical protein
MLRGVAHWAVTVDLIAILAAITGMRDVAGNLKIDQNSLNGALGNANDLGYLTRCDMLVAVDAKQNLGVVGQKGPC